MSVTWNNKKGLITSFLTISSTRVRQLTKEGCQSFLSFSTNVKPVKTVKVPLKSEIIFPFSSGLHDLVWCSHMLQSDIPGKRVLRQNRIASASADCGIFFILRHRKKEIWCHFDQKRRQFVWPSPRNYASVSFAKALCFLELPLPRSSGNLKFETEQCCCADGEHEYCFLQYFEILSGRKLKMNRIIRVFNWIHLRWQRLAGVVKQFPSVQEFGLVPVDAIREVSQTFRENSTISLLDENNLHAKSLCETWNGDNGWKHE